MVEVEAPVTVHLHTETLTVDTSEGSRAALGSAMKNINFNPKPSEATARVLEEELENCNQLIELEPDSKWPNYTKAMIMKTLDCKKYLKEIIQTLERLESIDKMRRNYYQDQKSKLIIETMLENCNNFDSIDFSGHTLSTIYHQQYLNFFQEVKY